MAGLHFRNASWSGLAAAIRAAAGLLSALLAIRLLGPSQYGHVATWLSLFVLYLSLNSSAFTMVVVNLMAIDGGAPRQQRTAVTAAAARFCIWSLAVLAGVTALLSASVTQLPVAVTSMPKPFSEVIQLMGVLTAIQIFIALQVALIEGAGRLDLATKSQLLGPLVILGVLATSFFGESAFGAHAYLILLCGAGAIDLALLWRIRRLLDLPLLPSDPEGGDAGGVLQLLRSGGLLQAASLLNLFLEPVNKFLLNHFAGSAVVAIYDLAMKVIWGIQHLVGAAMRVFLHIGSQDSAAVSRTFARAVVLLGVPVVAMHIAGTLFLFFAARYWLAIDGTELIIFFGIATISNLGMIFVTPLYLSLISRQDLVFVFRTQAVLATINVAVSAAAIPLLGVVGAAFGLLAATIFNAMAIYLRCCIDLGVYRGAGEPMLLARRRVALAIALLVATIAWSTYWVSQPLVIVAILVGLGVIMVREPLVAMMIEQFVARRT
jgi:O-antigen/teichoic acid export membrane protein